MSSIGTSTSTANNFSKKFLAIFLSALLALSMFNIAAFANGDGSNNDGGTVSNEAQFVTVNFAVSDNAYAKVDDQVVGNYVNGIEAGRDFVFEAYSSGTATLETPTYASNGIDGKADALGGNSYSIPAGFVSDGLTINVEATMPEVQDITQNESPEMTPFVGDGSESNVGGSGNEVTANTTDKITLDVDVAGGELATGAPRTGAIRFSAPQVDGVVLLIPKTTVDGLSISFGSNLPSSVTVTDSTVGAFTANGVSVPAGDYWVVSVVNAKLDSGGFYSSLPITYMYKNGTTPAGVEVVPSVYAIQGSAVESAYGPLTIMTDGLSAYKEGSKLTSTTNETIGVSKSITKINGSTDLSGKDATTLTPSDFNSVGKNEKYTVEYEINVTTTGKGETGRVFQKNIQFDDTLSGFLANGQPEKIVLKDDTTGKTLWTLEGADLSAAISNGQFVFNVNVMDDAKGAVFNGVKYSVVVTYDKDAYTKLNGQENLTAPVTITNSASAKYKPVTSTDYIDVPASTVTNNIGFAQKAPGTVALNINKLIKNSGSSHAYNSAYGPITFTLTPTSGTPITATVGLDGVARFIDIPADMTYTLTESAVSGFSSSIGNGIVVKVAAPNASGINEVTIGETKLVLTNDTYSYDVVNTSTTIGYAQVTVYEQKPGEMGTSGEKNYRTPLTSKVVYLYKADGTTPVLVNGVQVQATTNASGVATFYNLPVGNYTVKSDGYTIENATTGNLDYKPQQEAVALVVSNSSVGKADYRFDCQQGGIYIGKNFQYADNKTPVAGITSFEATFQLFSGDTPVAGTEFKVTSGTASYIPKYMPTGTYTLKETSLKINGAVSNDYTPYVDTVTIAAGQFKSMADHSTAGVVTNVSNFGQLKVVKQNLEGDAMTGFDFKIAGSAYNNNSASVDADGTWIAWVPAGTYTITENAKDGYVVDSVNGTKGETSATINVAAQSLAAANTATFKNAALPKVTGTKVLASDGTTSVNNAVFTLYKLVGDKYVKQPTTATSTVGVFTFSNLEAGDYIFVETTTPEDFIDPTYVKAFKEEAVWKAEVDKETAEKSGAPMKKITAADYESTAKTINLGTITNAHSAKVTVNKVDASTGNTVSGATFELYKKNDKNGWDKQSSFSGLTEGEYYIAETTAPTGYVKSGETIKFKVDAKGVITTLDGNTVASDNIPIYNGDTKGSKYAKSACAYSASTSAMTVSFPNAKTTSINLTKKGETNVFGSDNKRVVETLPGAQFRISYGSKYLTFDRSGDEYKVIGSVDALPTGDPDKTIITSGTTGTFNITGLDPNTATSYTLTEINSPAVPGSSYLTYAKLADVSITLTEAKDGNGKITGYTTTSSAGNILTNEIATYSLKLTKWNLNPTTGEKTGSPAFGGVFNIYQFIGVGAAGADPEGYSVTPIDTMVTGTANPEEFNTAMSNQLPAGKYRLVEVKAPAYAAANNEIWTKNTSGKWVKTSSLTYDFELPLNSSSPIGSIENLELGNTDAMVVSPGGATYVHLNGEKLAYKLVPNDENPQGYDEIPQGHLLGVTFDVYPAYIDNKGVYHKLTETPETVTTGAVESGGKLLPGNFLTSILELNSDFKNKVPAAEKANVTGYGYIIIEKSGLPAGYDTSIYGQPFYAQIDETKVVTAKDGSKVIEATVSMKNFAGSGILSLSKYGETKPANGTTTLPGAEFEVYRATSANADPSTWTQVKKTDKDGKVVTDTEGKEVSLKITTTSSVSEQTLAAGYYFLKEVKAPTGYNTFGSKYTVDGADKGGFNGVIGPILIGGKANTPVEIFDKAQGAVTIVSLWNGETSDSAKATYEYKKSTDSTWTAVPADGILPNLSDGTYTVRETGINSTDYLGNTAAQNGIEIVVDNGVVKSVKVNGAAVPTANDNTTGVWANPLTTVNVNHLTPGGLMIKMGYIDYKGAAQNNTTPAGYYSLDQAVFTITNISTGEITTATWSTSADNLKVISLSPGTYKVEQTNVYDSTGNVVDSSLYSIDSAPVYVKIENGGVVYLQNNRSNNGIVSTESAPLTKTNSGDVKYFYDNINLGELKIVKVESGTTEKLTGAEFVLCSDAAGTDVLPYAVTATAEEGVYSAIVPASATYYVKETKAPTNYDICTVTTEVNVAANTTANITSMTNAISIPNAKTIDLTVHKVSTYPEIVIDGVKIEGTGTEFNILGLEIDLYRSDTINGVYAPYKGSVTWVNTGSTGTVEFKNLPTGFYRVVEGLPTDGALSYLALNPRYALANVQDGSQALTIEVYSDNGTLKFRPITVDFVDDAFNASSSTLTIDNAFSGFVPMVKKVDYDDPSKPLEGAKFELWRTYVVNGVEKSEKVGEKTTDAKGIAWFEPRYEKADANVKYFLKEVSAPGGYILNAYYDAIEKEVPAPTDGSKFSVVEFKNKKGTDTSAIGVTKAAEETLITTPLRESGFSNTYTITPTVANTLPLSGYKVTDHGFTFKGNTSATGSSLNAFGGTQPTYTISEVVIGAASAYTTADAKSKSAVYARLDSVMSDGVEEGQVWYKLDQAVSVVPVAGAIGFEVVYTNNPETDASPVVGSYFEPGVVTVKADFNKFAPSDKTQPEVSRIENTAVVWANGKDVSQMAAVTVDVASRPHMAVTKTLDNYMTDNKVNVFSAGDELNYTLTMTNTEKAGGKSITSPVLIDYMQKEAMYIKTDAEGEPQYTAYLNDQEIAANCEVFNGEVVYWSFPSLALAPGETIKITFTAKLSSILTSKDGIVNTAYGTSATALSYSPQYPTGASFVAAEGSTTLTSGSVFNELETYSPGKGLYVSATAQAAQTTSSGRINPQRSIGTGDAANISWNSSGTPSNVSPGDTFYYRLRLFNDTTDSATNVVFQDTLPFAGDDVSTQWQQDALLNKILFNSKNAFVVTKVSGATTTTLVAGDTVNGYTIKYYNASGAEVTPSAFTLADIRSYTITFGTNVKFEAGDVFSAVCSLTMPSKENYSDDAYAQMLSDNTGKLANARFTGSFKVGQTTFSTPSNVVKAKLVADLINITGWVWNDANRNGIFDYHGADGVEQLLGGVPVLLYKSMDGGTTWTCIAQTVTGESGSGYLGEYSFTGLESGYGYNGQLQYRVSFINQNPATHEFSDRAIHEEWRYTHVSKLQVVVPEGSPYSGSVEGFTDGVALVADGEFNCGINAKLFNVTYVANDSATNKASNIPAAEQEIAGKTYTVKGSDPVPTRPGYIFDGWKVTKGQTGMMGNFYGAGQPFTMPANDVELTAQWTADKSKIEVGEYEGVYDGVKHQVPISGLLTDEEGKITDTVEYYVDDEKIPLDGLKDVVFDKDGNPTWVTVDVVVIRDGVIIYDSRDSESGDKSGRIKIKQATIKVVTGSNTWIYDGYEKTENGTVQTRYGTMTGWWPDTATVITPADSVTGNIVELIEGLESAPIFITGKVKDVNINGDSQPKNNNYYEIDWATAIKANPLIKESNYKIVDELGTLLVKDYDETLIVNLTGGTWVYDGKTHAATAEFASATPVPDGYTVTAGPSTSSVVRNVADGTVVPVCDNLVITNGKGEEVYNLVKGVNILKVQFDVLSDLKILPATIYVSTGTDSKTYDGTPLYKDGSMYAEIGNGNKGATEIATVANTSLKSPNGVSNDFYNVTLLTNKDNEAEAINIRVTGSQTPVGGTPKNNTYELNWADSKHAANYTIVEDLGTLTVVKNSAAVDVVIADKAYTYDGKPHGTTITINGEEFTGFPIVPFDGYTVESAVTNATATNVADGTVPAILNELIIKDMEGNVVAKFVDGKDDPNNEIDPNIKINVTVTNGSVKINPVEIKVVTGSNTWTYDGETKTMPGTATVAGAASQDFTPDGDVLTLVNNDAVQETATFKITSSITEPGGPINNLYSITWPSGVDSKNYNVTHELGELEVVENDAEIEIVVNGGTWEYDGLDHAATLTWPELPKGYSYKTDPASDDTVKNVVDGTKTATVNHLEIVNAQGTTVAKVTGIDPDTGVAIIEGTLNVTIVPGVNGYGLNITPAPLTITTDGATRVYTGKPLTAAGYTFDGLKNGETIDFKTTGSQTQVGSSENTYTIDWTNATKSNYYIASEKLGVLTVYQYDGQLVVTTIGGTYTYNGTTRGATVTVSPIPEGYTIALASSNTQATDVTGSALPAKCDDLTILNAGGEEVFKVVNGQIQEIAGGISKDKVIFVNGSLQINPVRVLVTTDSATRQYNGTALTAGGRYAGLVNGETINFSVTGSQTAVGRSTNTYALNWNGTAKASNYYIEERLGTLTVTAVPPVTPPGGGGTGGGGGTTTPDDPLAAVITPIADLMQSGVATVIPRETTIGDDGTPLAGNNLVWCWVHWYIVLGMIISSIYSVAVIARRRKFTKRLMDYENDVMGQEQEEKTQYGTQGVSGPATQGMGA